jgi:hypothetical protein
MPDVAFQQQVWLSVFDKLFLGSVVGIAGLWGSRQLESYRAKRAMAEEVAKRRMDKLIPLWHDLDTIEQDLSEALGMAFRILEHSNVDAEQVHRPLMAVHARIDKARKDMFSSKFVLGARLLKLHETHLRALEDLHDTMQETVSRRLGKGIDEKYSKELGDIKSRFDVAKTRVDIQTIIKMA